MELTEEAKVAILKRVSDLKLLKSKHKSVFTKTKNKVIQCVDVKEGEDINKIELRKLQDYLDDANEVALGTMHKLCSSYRELNDTVNEGKIMDEIEILEKEYSEAHKIVYNACMSTSAKSVSAGGASSTLGKDMWQQLKRVQIPVFSGEKRKYESWKAAFYACIDSAPATAEYKLLQLRQYLSGEALKSIENLGHSAVSYNAAKERLERKFGGKRRQVMAYLEELDKFPPMREENAKTIEKFADLLDIVVINLTEAEKEEDLKDGTLYLKLQRKMPETMLTRYNRWIFENREDESVQTLRKWLNQEAKYYVAAAETVHGLSGEKWKSPKNNPNTHFTSDRNPQSKTKICKVCSDNHDIWNCSIFKQLSAAQRWNKAKELKLCFRCLGSGHSGSTCNRMKVCGIQGCRKNHNRLLHCEESSAQNHAEVHVQYNHNMEQHTHNSCDQEVNTSQIGLRTVPVIVKNGNKQLMVNALLDDGSSKSYINSDVAAELGLDIGSNAHLITVNVMNGRKETFETTPVNFLIESLNGQVKMAMEATTTNHVTGNLKTIDWNKHSQKYQHLQRINFPLCRNRNTVDLLIGVDYSDLHFSLYEIRGNPGEPIARLTPLGWTCVGAVTNMNENEDRNYHTFFLQNDVNLDKSIEKFWEIEHIPQKENSMSIEDSSVVKQVESETECHNGHYQVPIPWNSKKSCLTNNYELALQRLKNTEKKLEKDAFVKEAYTETIKKYESKGYISKVKQNEKSSDGTWYLPHFPVIKLDRETTKVRIVFDASAKKDGISLNDAIHQGPKLQNELFDVLMRFRSKPVAIICDIEEMYLRVGIHPTDRSYHRFLWNSSAPVQYEFNSLVFGVNSSPFLAQFVARKNAELHEREFPRAAETVLYSTYMDDSMDSVETVEEGIELYHQLSELWAKANMYARKWLSNSKAVLENIPIEHRTSKVEIDQDSLPSVKTLGVTWLANDDCFVFNVQVPEENTELTKRLILRKTASIFDPHGFLAPYVIRAKMIMQELWIAGLEWDELVNSELSEAFWKWLSELNELQEIKVPRCIKMEETASEKITLHAFGDASEKAYGAVVYARCENAENEISVRLVAAKSRVAPVKTVSIPRLELLSAVLCLKLTLAICAALNICVNDCNFWTDSMNVLHWIRNRSSKFKPFVANRVGEIQQLSKPLQWRHVIGKQNPADIVSRGLSVSKLKTSELWWKGPEFLQKDESEWRRIQELIRHFWNRWLKEWLPSLQTLKKWHKVQPDLKINDVVIVMSSDMPRAQWPLGRITRVHKSRDGHVRAANVLMNGKELVRPITKLCPLEVTGAD